MLCESCVSRIGFTHAPGMLPCTCIVPVQAIDENGGMDDSDSDFFDDVEDYPEGMDDSDSDFFDDVEDYPEPMEPPEMEASWLSEQPPHSPEL